MPRVLLVKTSSLGDVVHNLPVASDVAQALPGAEIDWVVEEAYTAVPALHAHVARAIPAAFRRWRGTFWRAAARREMRAFVERLRSVPYDAVVDTQGLLKSALISRLARGARYGLDWASSREPLFAFYDRTIAVPRALHAVERNRSLAAQALGYTLPARVDYGIGADGKASKGNAAVLVHATSAAGKLWAEDRWIALGQALSRDGLACVLPWGTADEQRRAERLAAAISGAKVAPRMTLAEVAALLARSRAVVGLDTGLTHLAGALGVPTVGIYTATDPRATGLFGCPRAANVGGCGANPDVAGVLQTLCALSP